MCSQWSPPSSCLALFWLEYTEWISNVSFLPLFFFFLFPDICAFTCCCRLLKVSFQGHSSFFSFVFLSWEIAISQIDLHLLDYSPFSFFPIDFPELEFKFAYPIFWAVVITIMASLGFAFSRFRRSGWGRVKKAINNVSPQCKSLHRFSKITLSKLCASVLLRSSRRVQTYKTVASRGSFGTSNGILGTILCISDYY